MEQIELGKVEDQDLFHALWRAGDLSWLLHTDQAAVHTQYRAWAAQNPNEQDGILPRVFVLGIARRWGKTYLCLLLKFEDCLRDPGSGHTYATALQKDIADILIPLARHLSETAPEDCRPVYRVSKQGETGGFYFPNGSSIKLVGLDRNPDGLRGRASDGVVISEAVLVASLKHAVRDVLYPQFQGRPKARIILESSAPEYPESDFDDFFLPDAIHRGAYVERTIDDNPILPAEEREEFIKAAGGRGSPTCEREYYNVRTRDGSRVVIPEFSVARHVKPVVLPPYADAYVAIDPGIRDLCALVYGFWDFKRAKLCIQACWAERNAGTPTVAEQIKVTEKDLWSDLTAWNGKEFKSQPYMRVADTDLRLLTDLDKEHGIQVRKIQGSRSELKEPVINGLRTAFVNDQIEIDPSCVALISHITAARWNASRTDYQRTEVHGHYDLLDALTHLWKSIVRQRNPYPPEHLGRSGVRVLHPEARMSRPAQALSKAFDLMAPGQKHKDSKKRKRDHGVPRL